MLADQRNISNDVAYGIDSANKQVGGYFQGATTC
jgi:hypothetical protein